MHLGRKFKLAKLNDNSMESFYWLGFLLADGHFYKNGRVKICLAEKDIKHLEKFVDFVGCGTVRRYGDKVEVSIMDVHNAEILMNKYSITNHKTIDPPNLSALNVQQIKAVSIGFIDGDGHIRKQLNREGSIICVKVHKSWLETLPSMFIGSKAILQNSGYAFLSIGDNKKIKDLKVFALENNLPIMNRKWDIINLDFISKYEISNERLPIIKEMLDKKTSQKEIATYLGLSKSNLSQLIKRHELRSN